MGIDTDRFISTIPQGAYCVTCGETLEDPIEIIDCGHLLCSECWEDVKCNENEGKCACPFCGALVDTSNIRKATLTWSLIQNMDVYCPNKDLGCESIYKYAYESLHQQKCAYGDNASAVEDAYKSLEKCSTCGTPAYEGKHDCTSELLRKLRRQSIQITNLELENSKIAFKLATRGKQSEEGSFLMESLRYNKEIRDLRMKLALIQGEIGRRKGDCKLSTVSLSLERINGTLGFNIIGGKNQKEENHTSGGIFVSRIVEGGAADQPGKLQLHDQIIEVDGVDLRSATHAFAVETFRNSGDPVKMTIQRQLKTSNTCEASTQTYGVMFAVTGEEKSIREKELQFNIKNKTNWLTLHDFNEKDSINNTSSVDEPVEQLVEESKDENKSELYDSAYDTLLTQKSTRSVRQSSSNESGLDNDNVTNKKSTSPTLDAKEKRQSTFFVIPGGEESCNESLDQREMWEDCSAAEQEIEYEYEYEEVVLRKEDGKYGLLLCYGGDATDVAVYVGDMEENSVADTSNNIMVGDQVVQINGCQVSDVDQAYQMLQENDEIQVIVARAVYDVQSEYYDDAEETDLDMLDSIIEESEPNYEKQRNGLTSASSASTSTISSKSATSSQKALSNMSTQVQVLSKLNDTPTSESHNFTTITDNVLVDCSTSDRASNSDNASKIEKDSVKNSIKNFMKNALTPSEKKDKRSSSNSDDSTEIPKCPRSNSNSSIASGATKLSNGSVTKSQDSTDLLKEKLKEQKKISKLKAYADSPSLNRHRPNTNLVTNINNNNNTMNNVNKQTNSIQYQTPNIEYIPYQSDPPIHPLLNGVSSSNIVNSNPNINRTFRTGSNATPSLKSAMKNSFRERVESSSKSVKKQVSIDPHPDWNDTERRVWEEFKIIQSMEAKENKAQPEDDMKIEAEWRVRRSKDGKHIYIKKTNSSRNKVLKEREKQIDQQRCGITTDDDAFTVYQGQYWSKDQRRRQLNRHNDRRKRLVQKSAERASYENKTERAMAEMVQRKMTLPGKVFDDFITVEEILTQRNRTGISQGPIHVTTI